MSKDLNREIKNMMKDLKYPLMSFFAQIVEFTEQMFYIKLALFLIGGDYSSYV